MRIFYAGNAATDVEEIFDVVKERRLLSYWYVEKDQKKEFECLKEAIDADKQKRNSRRNK